jgi:hypothetical protein
MSSPLPSDASKPSLDPNLYFLTAKETEFYKAQTGIQDDEELKEHILAVQRDAYEVIPLPLSSFS